MVPGVSRPEAPGFAYRLPATAGMSHRRRRPTEKASATSRTARDARCPGRLDAMAREHRAAPWKAIVVEPGLGYSRIVRPSGWASSRLWLPNRFGFGALPTYQYDPPRRARLGTGPSTAERFPPSPRRAAHIRSAPATGSQSRAYRNVDAYDRAGPSPYS